jgi:hypothetical protein
MGWRRYIKEAVRYSLTYEVALTFLPPKKAGLIMSWSTTELAFGLGVGAFFLLRSLINRRFDRLEKMIRKNQPVDDDDRVKED